MPRLTDYIDLPSLIGYIASAIFVFSLMYKAWPIVRKVNQMADDWLGTPERPGHPKVMGMMERIAHVERDVKAAKHEHAETHERIASLEYEHAQVVALLASIGNSLGIDANVKGKNEYRSHTTSS